MQHETLAPDISIQQIQIFLKAVELGNFSRVGECLNYSTSTISKKITLLEETLGIKLFIRNPHDVVPTPEARLLASEWRHVIASINNSIEKVHYYQETGSRKVVFGFVDSSGAIDEQINNCVSAYMHQHPSQTIVIEKHDMHREVELLRFGLLDLIFTSGNELPYLEDPEIVWEKVYDTRVIAYVPQKSPLFDRSSLSVSDLAGIPLTSLDPQMHPAYSAWLKDLCMSCGFTPNIVSTFRTVRSLLFNLRLNPNVFVGETMTIDSCGPDLHGFDLGKSSFCLLAWRKGAGDHILSFKDAMKKALIEGKNADSTP